MRQWVFGLGLGLGLTPACSDSAPADASTESGVFGLATEGNGSEDTGAPLASAGDGADSPRFDLGPGGDEVPAADATGDCGTELEITLRDFLESHPDMQYKARSSVERGIVEGVLGDDDLPVYRGRQERTTTGKDAFDQWYRDVPGVNMAFSRKIQLVRDERGFLTFDSNAYFPLDGEGFGNEGHPHNYHFTLELHTSFTYGGGEVFTFRGDDDVFVFINGGLALDLGGVHPPVEGTMDMDTLAPELGLELGETYPLDFFFAERHTVESNFRIETSIECFDIPVSVR